MAISARREFRTVTPALRGVLLAVILAPLLAGCGPRQPESFLVMESAGETKVIETASVTDAPRVRGRGLTVLVTDTDARDRPISGAEVQLIPVGLPPISKNSDSAGLCHFEDLRAESYAISVSHGEYAPNRGVVEVSGATNLVQVVLRHGPKIRVRVFDAETNQPVPSFRIAFEGDSYGLSSRWRDGFVSMETEAGVVEVTGITRAFRVIACAEGYAPFVLPLPDQLVASEQTSMDFPMRHSAVVTGTIRDREGMPIAGAQIDLATRSLTDYFEPVRTDAQGAFRLDALMRTPVSLSVTHRDFAREVFELPSVKAGETLTLDWVLRRGATILGTVTMDGVPLHNARAMAMMDSGMEFAGENTERDGQFLLRRIPPGQVRVRVVYSPSSQGAEMGPVDLPTRDATQTFTLADGDSKEVHFAFSETGSVMEGFVTFNGEPLTAEVGLFFERDGARYSVMSRTDDGGWYQLNGVPPGVWRSMVQVLDMPRYLRRSHENGNPLATRHTNVTVPESGYLQQDFDLGKGGTIRGSIASAAPSRGPYVVFVSCLQDEPDPHRRHDSVPTSDDGHFTIVGLTPGTYRLAAISSGGPMPFDEEEERGPGIGSEPLGREVPFGVDFAGPGPGGPPEGPRPPVLPHFAAETAPHRMEVNIAGEEEAVVTLELDAVP